MKTRHQIKQRRSYNNYIRKLKYDSWLWGKRQYGSSRHNCYSIKNANINVSDRCDGYLYDFFNTNLGSYNGPETRSMSEFRKRQDIARALRLFYRNLNIENVDSEVISKIRRNHNRILESSYGSRSRY